MSSDHPKVKNFSSPRLYKGNSKSILAGCSCKHPSLNSHENGVLRGCFFKNSKYVYNIPSHLIAIGSAQIKRGKQTFLSSNSRRERPIYQMQNEIPLLITCHLPRRFERMSRNIFIYNHTTSNAFWNHLAKHFNNSVPNSLDSRKIRRLDQKLTARKQKEKAAIVACKITL